MSTAETPGSSLRVTTLANNHVRVLGTIVVEVGTEFHVEANRLVTPDMLGTPVPSFPAVRVTYLLGVAAEEFHQVSRAAMTCIDYLALGVAFGLEADAFGAVFVDDSLDFAVDDVKRLVPGDSHVLAGAAVLGVPLAVGIPVNPLEGIEDTVGRIDSFFIGVTVGRIRGLERGYEFLAPRHEFPWPEFLRIVFPVPV